MPSETNCRPLVPTLARYVYAKDGDMAFGAMAPGPNRAGSCPHGYDESQGCWKTLEDYRKALLAPSWKYTLSYETRWMTRDDIVQSSYEAGLRLNRLKEKYGLLDKVTADRTEKRILLAREMIGKVDEIILQPEPKRTRELMTLKETFDQASMSTVCDKEEIKWPVLRWRLNFPNIFRAIFQRPPG